MAQELEIETEGLDLGSLLRKHNLEHLLVELESEHLNIDNLKHATESNLREISKAFGWTVFDEIKFIAAIKSIPNVTGAQSNDTIYSINKEQAVLDTLNNKQQELANNIHQIQSEIICLCIYFLYILTCFVLSMMCIYSIGQYSNEM